MPFPIANVAQAGLGLFQTFEGLRGLKNLSRTAFPRYSVSPELQHSYGRAEEMSQRGYSPEETAAFKGNMAGLNAQRFQRASDVAGGGLSQAIQSGINYGSIKGLLGYAADDASLHRRNIQYADSLARAIQSQKNLITQGDIQHRMNQEQAYGGGLRRGLENIVNPLNLTQALAYQKGFSNKTANMGGSTTMGNPNNPPYANVAPYQYPLTTDYSTNAYGTGMMNNPYPYPYSDFGMYGLNYNPYAPYSNPK